MTDDLVRLFVLAMPVAAIAWAVTHEEMFKEPRDYCTASSRAADRWRRGSSSTRSRASTCFSHWVTLGLLLVTRFTLLYDDWRGYVVSGFSLVWIANIYMSLFGRLRLDIKSERVDITLKENVARQGSGPRRNTA